MSTYNPDVRTLADVLNVLAAADLAASRRRDLVSAVKRIAELIGADPAGISVDVPSLRPKLSEVRPARHGISAKTYSTLRSGLVAALGMAGAVDLIDRTAARKDAGWGPLFAALGGNKELSAGLGAFANWAVANQIAPEVVTDAHVQKFAGWIETRSLNANPKRIVREIPIYWEKAQAIVSAWPKTALSPISFRAASPSLAWKDLPAGFQADVEDYLARRGDPDVFDDNARAPKRPLSASTLARQKEHFRLAASVLIRQGNSPDALASLKALVTPEAFKAVLRHYHKQAGGKANAFVVSLGKTLIDVARYHTNLSQKELEVLKTATGRLRAIPFDLTDKNKALLQNLDNDALKARLLFLPERLLGKVAADLEKGIIRFVEAQVAIAVDILLIAPLRPQNLVPLNWSRHFQEPNGPKGDLVLRIPKDETKTGHKDLAFDLPADLSKRIRWYRRHILPRLGADSHGNLFVTGAGTSKGQSTLTVQMIKVIEDEVGVRMTPHQFRHFSAHLHLDEHPESFQTISDLLGHSWAKTTQIYAGTSSRRASRAYGAVVLGKREALKLKQPSRRPRRPRKK